jgi:hypothetical protein
VPKFINQRAPARGDPTRAAADNNALDDLVRLTVDPDDLVVGEDRGPRGAVGDRNRARLGADLDLRHDVDGGRRAMRPGDERQGGDGDETVNTQGPPFGGPCWREGDGSV